MDNNGEDHNIKGKSLDYFFKLTNIQWNKYQIKDLIRETYSIDTKVKIEYFESAF